MINGTLALALLLAPLAAPAVTHLPAPAAAHLSAPAVSGLEARAVASLAAAKPARGSAGWKAVGSVTVGSSVVTVRTRKGFLVSGDNAITVAVTDPAGKPKSAKVKGLNLYMPEMGSMEAMSADATLRPARTPGVYTGALIVEMKGPWKVTVTFDDRQGSHRASFEVVAR